MPDMGASRAESLHAVSGRNSFPFIRVNRSGSVFLDSEPSSLVQKTKKISATKLTQAALFFGIPLAAIGSAVVVVVDSLIKGGVYIVAFLSGIDFDDVIPGDEVFSSAHRGVQSASLGEGVSEKSLAASVSTAPSTEVSEEFKGSDIPPPPGYDMLITMSCVELQQLANEVVQHKASLVAFNSFGSYDRDIAVDDAALSAIDSVRLEKLLGGDASCRW